jgi:polyhydroxybutyrate depolymerase
MRRTISTVTVTVTVTVAALVLAACAGDDTTTQTTAVASSEVTAPPADVAVTATPGGGETTLPEPGLEVEEDEAPIVDPCAGITPPPPGDVIVEITSDERTREYALTVPSTLDATSPTPVVFNLHGRGSDRVQQFFYGAFGPLAERDGWLLVHPQGITPDGQSAQQWNFSQVFDTGYSDEAFILAIIDDIADRVCIDRTRIFSTGMSSGGFMSSSLACRHPDVFAAVAPVAGSAAGTECGDDRPVPFLTLHGTNDDVVAFGAPFDIAGTASAVAARNGCADDAAETRTGAVVERRWTCDESAETVLYVVEEGGHTWPGSPIDVPGLGATNRDVSATEIIWEFFGRHAISS